MGNHDPYPVINIHGTLAIRQREFTPTSDNTDLHNYVNSLQYLIAMELQQLLVPKTLAWWWFWSLLESSESYPSGTFSLELQI
jgi:hypothetical protein